MGPRALKYEKTKRQRDTEREGTGLWVEALKGTAVEDRVVEQ
jgi:hypothetical protein